jgi:CRISPR-associated protein Csx3
MSAIELQAIPRQVHAGLPYTHIHIRIVNESGVIVPADLKDVKFPEGIDFKKGVILEGKAPIWLYGCLIHYCYHFAPWVGCYDPRLGAVIVATRTPQVSHFEVFSVDLPTSPSHYL